MARSIATHDLTHQMFFGDWHDNKRRNALCTVTGGPAPLRVQAEWKDDTTTLGFKMRMTRHLNELRESTGREPHVYEETHQRPNQNDRLVCVVSTTKDNVTYSDLFILAAKDGIS